MRALDRSWLAERDEEPAARERVDASQQVQPERGCWLSSCWLDSAPAVSVQILQRRKGGDREVGGCRKGRSGYNYSYCIYKQAGSECPILPPARHRSCASSSDSSPRPGCPRHGPRLLRSWVSVRRMPPR